MKKCILAVFVLVMCLTVSPCSLFAYDKGASNEYKNALTLEPLGLLFGQFSAKYTIKLSDANALSIDASYWGYNMGLWSSSAIGIGGSVDFFFQRNALTGFYAGPAINALFFSSSTGTTSSNVSSTWIGIGGKIGYRWILDGGMVIDVNTMLRYLIGTNTAALNINGFGISGLGAGIGFAF